MRSLMLSILRFGKLPVRLLNVSGVLAILAVATVASSGPAQFGGPIPPTMIPDGGVFPLCDSPGALMTVTVPGPAAMPGSVITDLSITVGFGTVTHTWYGDVHLRVTHCGVSVTLMNSPADCGDDSDLFGTYTFSDSALMFLDTAAATVGPNAIVPNGTYQADNVLAPFLGLPCCGTWTFDFWDDAAGDVGYVNWVGGYLICSPGPPPYKLSLSQCRAATAAGPAPLLFEVSGGMPGRSFVNAIALAPGTSPLGWFFGLDIPLELFVFEIGVGVPFVGALDGCGSFSLAVPGVPPGLTLYYVSVQYTPGVGVILPTSPPAAGTVVYTTM